jgi:hypothetical protein
MAEIHTLPTAGARPVANPPAVAHEVFKVDSLEKADWVLEVLGSSEGRKAQNKLMAQEAHRRVEGWLEEVNGQEDKDTSFLRSSLEAFMSTARELILGKKTEKKSRVLPNGTIGWKSSIEKLVYDDEAIALEWCKEQGAEAGLYRIVFMIEKDAVKRYCALHKVVPPGAHLEGGADEPYIKPSVLQLPAAANHPMKKLTKKEG